MSTMRKIGEYLGLVEDSRYDEEYDYYEGEETQAYEPAPRREEVRPERVRQPKADKRPRHGGHESQVTDLAERRRPTVVARPVVAQPVELSRIVTITPKTYNEARSVGEEYRNGTPVIMNLTEMDDVDAKRLVDFGAGLAFGSFGTIERVTNKVFLLSPASVSVTAEDKARIVEDGFFNQS